VLGLDFEAEYYTAGIGGGGDDLDVFLEEVCAPALVGRERLVVWGIGIGRRVKVKVAGVVRINEGMMTENVHRKSILLKVIV